jgi:hypothetical protein
MKHVAIAALTLLGFVGSLSAQTPNTQAAAHPTRTVAKKKTATAAKKKTSTAVAAKPSPRISSPGRKALAQYQPRPDSDERPDLGPVVPYAGPPTDHTPVTPVRSRPLRELPVVVPDHPGKGDHPGRDTHPEPIRPQPPVQPAEPDTTPIQTSAGAVLSAPTSTGVGFDGVGVGLGGFSPTSNPPDVNGRVGATQYVQWNNTSLAVFNKTTGALLLGPLAGNMLFQSLGGACASHNDGDPVVMYDVLAGRWILSQFVVVASPNYSHQCVAVSVTGDATGSYYLYDFVTDATNFVDYPHIGVWSDGYYMTTHVFNAAGTAQVAARVNVFERDKMLLGQSARMLAADLSKKSNKFQYGFLPADLDSLTPPPAGEASFVMGPDPAFTNRTDVTRVAVTWGTTPAITLTEGTVSVGIGNAPCVNNTAAQENRDCVPQPSPAVGADYLDNISFHYMYRIGYRNFGGSPVQESLVVSALTAGSASTPSHGAVRWFEFRNAGNSTSMPTSFQAATYDPDTAYRWLPSIAMDKDHNIALGYSKSSTTVKPGIFMTGRLGTDTVNTMGAEATVQAGLGVQTTGAGNRWGDYSAMTLDPIDQCTFYYTNEYLKTNGAFNWSTRIASYKFPSCTAAAAWGTVSGNVTSCATGVPLSGVVVSLSNGFAGSTDAAGNFSIPVPAGSYTITAADTDRNCSTASPASAAVSVSSGGTSTQNFCMTGSSNLQFNSRTIDDSVNGNNNGIINANECVNLSVTLKNNGCANETGTSATLTTSTAGVTVTQGSSTYPDMAIDATGANATPFKIQTSNSFVCGTVISLTLNVTYASGNKSISISLPTCAGGADQTIPASSLTAADLTQADRLGRDGVPSTCSGKPSPGGGFAGTKYYKKFNFANNGGSAACFTVTINAATGGAGDIESAAYLTAYDPANLSLNYLGDTGVSGLGTTVTSASYSFSVPALSTFVVVVNTTGTTTSSQFSGTVSGFFDSTAGPGPCPACIPPATPAITPGGATTFCSGGSVTLTSSAASGNQWSRDGTPIGGATNQTYNAIVTGSYTVTTTVAGCASAPSTAQAVTVNAIPATPTITPSGPTTFCTGGSVTLTSSSATGNQWSLNGSPISGATAQQYIANAGGNYTVIVTTSGCSSAASSTTTVTVNAIPATPTVTPGGPTTFCTPGSVTLSSSSASGNQWSLNGSSISGATGQQYIASASGNYTVVVTTSGCASAPSSAVTVIANQTPATPTITPSGPTTFCAGGSVTLTSSSATGNQWSLNGSPISGATGQQYVASASGNYTVVVTTSGCSSAASAATTVTVNAIPATPTVTPGGPTTFCAGGSVTLTSSSASGNQWSLNGSPISGATGQQYIASAAGSYTVVVTTSGCSSAASSATVVTVNPIPATPTVTPGGPTTFCTPGSVTLTSSSSTGNQWSLNGSPIGGATGQQYIASASGNYTVTVTTSGCTSAPSSAVTVTANATPATPTITPNGPTTFCAGGSVTLTSSSASGNQWYDGSTPLAAATNQTYIATASGNYNVVVSAGSCSSAPSASTAVTVNPLPPTPTITPNGPTTFCGEGTVTLTSSSASGNQWSLNGVAIGGATDAQFVATAAGNYTVTVTTTGCTSEPSAETIVTINPIPATPTITPGGPTTFCTGGSVTLSSSSASGNQWYLNGTPISGANGQQYVAGAAGSYTVGVTTSGCASAQSSATVVTVNAIPATPTITPSGPTTFCAGGSVTLTSSSATGNQWYLNGNAISGANAQQYIATAAGSYTVDVTTSGCASAQSAATVVTVNAIPATPTITPGGPTTFCAGGNVTLTSSSASGNQWYLNGNAVSGANGQQFIASAAGSYTVDVTTSGCTSAQSSATVVIVNAIPATPTITPGGSTTFCAGGSVTLTSSSASGNQWYLNGNPISGANAQQYVAGAAGSYTVDVTTSGCTSAQSAATVVTVNAIPATPTITPGGPTTFCAGGSVTLTSSSATGNQWYLNGNAISGANAQQYIAGAAGSYTVDVTTSGCTSAQASATVVTVNAIPVTPTITPGGPTTFCAGGSVTFTSRSTSGNQWYLNGNAISGANAQQFIASAAGSYTVDVTTAGCTSPQSSATAVTVNAIPATPTITPGGPTTFCAGGSVTVTSNSAIGNQWYLNGNAISGANAQQYIAGAAGSYTVDVTTSGCTSAQASATVVTVNAIPATPTITPGGPTTFCAGGSVTLTSSSATGSQWYLNGNAISGATGQQYIATSAAGSYTVDVTTSGCASAQSSATVVTVNAIPATPTITPGGPTTFCAGGSVTLTSSSATGNQWYLNGNAISGATSQQYIASGAGSYTVDVTTSGCTGAQSSATVVTVNATPATPAITPSGPTTFCAGGSVTLTSSSASGNQWYLNGNAISGATSQQYIASAAGSYTVDVTTSGCASAQSPATVVTVNAIPATPTITPGGPTTFCAGGSVTLTSSSATGNQWYLNGSPIGGATSQQYIASAAGSYTVEITTSGCTSAQSAATVVTVNAIPTTPAITPGGPTTFCAGGSVTLTSSSATGNQWYLNGNAISGATSQQYIAGAAGSYTVDVTTSGCTSAQSSATVVTVNAIPATPTITPGGPTTFCAGGSVTLTSSSATGNQWYLNGSPISGANAQQFIASAAGSYTVDVTTSGCASAQSSATVVAVNATPATPTITPGGPTTFCAGGSVTLTSSSTSGNQWYLNGNAISGATGQQYIASAAGSYTVDVTTSGCASAQSAATVVAVNATPATPTVTPGGATTFCAGGSVTLTSSSASAYHWLLNGNPITGASGQQYVATASGSYSVIVNSGGCWSAPSSSTTVTVTPNPATPTLTPSGPTTFCAPGSVTLTSSSGSGNQWYLNGNPISGGTGQTLLVSASGSYTDRVTGSGCSSGISAAVTVTVNPKPNVTITAPSSMFVGAGAIGSVDHECTGATFAWTITGGTITSGLGTRSITFTAGSAGTLTLFITVTNAYGCTDSKSFNVTVQQAAFGAPPYLNATAATTTSATLFWATTSTTDHYEIQRSTDNVNWTVRGTSSTNTFSESGLTVSTTYFYKVRAIKADTTASAFSPINAATTMAFTDPSLTTCGVVVKGVHITQLRSAINLARASVGLAAFTFTDPSLPAASLVIKAVHLTELRSAMAGFTSAIGVTPSYTDPTIVPGTTTIKAVHLQELRDLIQ